MNYTNQSDDNTIHNISEDDHNCKCNLKSKQERQERQEKEEHYAVHFILNDVVTLQYYN